MPIISVDVPPETVADATFIKKACGFMTNSEAYRNMLFRGRQAIVSDLLAERTAMDSFDENTDTVNTDKKPVARKNKNGKST